MHADHQHVVLEISLHPCLLGEATEVYGVRARCWALEERVHTSRKGRSILLFLQKLPHTHLAQQDSIKEKSFLSPERVSLGKDRKELKFKDIPICILYFTISQRFSQLLALPPCQEEKGGECPLKSNSRTEAACKKFLALGSKKLQDSSLLSCLT